MKKKTLTFLLAVLTAGLLAGCGGEENVSPVTSLEPVLIIKESSETAASESSVEASESESTEEKGEKVEGTDLMKGGETHTIGERVVKDGMMQSWLTGEWKDESVAKRRNMAVMINNIQVSLPQYGISQASIIYEAPVEGRITRLMGFFEDYDDLDHIGSVRSSRDYYIYEAMAYDSIYCNWGLARPWVEELINSDRIDNVSQALAGIYNGAPEAFDRISRPGIGLEHTGYLFIKGYKEAVARLGYETEYRSTFEKAFEFADEGYLATYDEKDEATKIYPGGTQSNSGGYGKHQPCFEYNPEDRLYYRTQYGKKQIDEMNNEQLAVTNVVFKICHGEERLPDDPAYDYLAFGCHGTGDAYVFTNGKVIKGTWRRDNDNAANLFFDEDGNEIVLNQGKTWICCIWKEFAEYASWE